MTIWYDNIEYYSLQEAAERLGVTIHAIKDYLYYEKSIPVSRIPYMRNIWISSADLEAKARQRERVLRVPLTPDICAKMKAIRERLGKSGVKMAQWTGVSWYRYEKGFAKTIPVSVLEMIGKL